MTTPTSAYTRLVISGDILATQSWSTGLSVSPPPGTVSQTDLNAWLAAVKPAVTTWWGTSTAGIARYNSPQTRLLQLRAYLYSGAEGAPAALQAVNDYTTPLAGATSSYMPTQTSLVASLLTGLPGRSYRGRCYTPATSLGLGSDHQLSQGDINAVAGLYKGLIDSINSISSPEFGSVVVHGIRGSYAVTSVRVDSEADIQRRRADKIVAARRGVATIA